MTTAGVGTALKFPSQKKPKAKEVSATLFCRLSRPSWVPPDGIAVRPGIETETPGLAKIAYRRPEHNARSD